MNRKLLQLMIYLGIGALFLIACNTSAPTLATSTPSLTFNGRLIVTDNKNIYEITNNSSVGQPVLLPITNNSTGFSDNSISPNNHYILFTMGLDSRTTLLIDLQTGETKTIVLPQYLEKTKKDHRTPCISWAPDGSKFSFPGVDAYYVYNLSTNKTTPIVKAPNEFYTDSIHGGTFPFEVTAEIGCGYWIGTDRLILQRFSGEMPLSVTFPDHPEVDTNATTLVTLNGESPQLVDFSERWFFWDMCKDGSTILVGDENGNPNISQNFADIENFTPTPIPACSDCVYWSFMPDDCNLFSVKEKADALDQYDVIGPIYLVDPTSMQLQTGPSLDEPFDHFAWEERVFVGDSSDLIIPLIVHEKGETNIILFNLVSKTKVTLLSDMDVDIVRFLAWLP